MSHGRQGLKAISKKRKKEESKAHSIIDRVTLVFAVIIPFITIPQILQLWNNKSSANVSLITWIAFLINAVVWLVYGVIHKDKLIIINSALWIILEFAVIFLIVIFRG